MELAQGQSLAQVVKVRRRLPEREAAGIVRQLADALGYMHGLDISHRDVKLENIMVDRGTVKLLDFGFSCFSKERLKIFCGTPSYMAPEIVSKREYLGGPADMWATGVVMYYILYGTLPFKSVTTEKELFRKINRGLFNLQVPGSPEAKDLLKALLNVDPTARPAAPALLEHPWLQI